MTGNIMGQISTGSNFEIIGVELTFCTDWYPFQSGSMWHTSFQKKKLLYLYVNKVNLCVFEMKTKGNYELYKKWSPTLGYEKIKLT
jgi:hypothetical protein